MTEDLLTALKRIQESATPANEKQSSFRGQFYGPSGTGKSVLAAMVMRSLVDITKQRIIHVDTSEGYVSWRNHPGLQDGITTLPFTSNEDLRAIAAGIKRKVPGWDNVGGIILDEASKMTEQDVMRVYEARLAGLYGDKEKALAQAQTGVEGRDYMIALERFKSMITDIFDNRDIHLILLAHEADKKDRQGNTISVFPDFTPKVRKSAKELLHLSAHITSEISKDMNDLTRAVRVRTAQVHPSSLVDAKCRLNISTTSVNADALPMLIKEWFLAGGVLEKPVDVIHPEISEGISVEGKSASEILEELEATEDAPADAVPVEENVEGNKDAPLGGLLNLFG